jgi:hypothetical protein
MFLAEHDFKLGDLPSIQEKIAPFVKYGKTSQPNDMITVIIKNTTKHNLNIKFLHIHQWKSEILIQNQLQEQ